MNIPYRFLLRRVRSRQVVLFSIGALLGCFLQLLTVWYFPFPRIEPGAAASESPQKDHGTPLAGTCIGQHVSLVANSETIDWLSGSRRPRKKAGPQSIYRWAKDEVRILDILKPMVFHTRDEFSATSAATWFREFGDGAKDVDLFAPKVLGSLVKQITGAGSVQTTAVSNDDKRLSETQHVVMMLQSLCNGVKDYNPNGKHVPPIPKLHRFKWFAFVHDFSYISYRRAEEFLSVQESSEALCFAHSRCLSNLNRPVWSARPGFFLNQNAVASLCRYTPQFGKILEASSDKEATFSALLEESGVTCRSPDMAGENYFLDLASVNITRELGQESLSNISALRHSFLFSTSSDVEMFLLRRSDKLDEIDMYNAKIRNAYDTLVNMQVLMRKYPLDLHDFQPHMATNVTLPSVNSLSGSVSDDDTIWMSCDANYQLSANFPAGSQRSAAFSKDVETQAAGACNHLKQQKDPLVCVNVVSAYVRFRPSIGMEYRFNLLVKSSVVDSIHAQPQYQSVTMVRRLSQMKVTSLQELDIRTPMYIVLPLLGRSVSFQSFMFMYERAVLLKQVNVVLIIAHFDEVPEEKAGQSSRGIVDPRTLITLYLNKYKAAQIKWVDVSGKTFSLVRGVNKALAEVSEDDTVLIMDPSLRFGKQFLARCKLTAQLGRQAYMPVAQPAPNAKAGSRECKARDVFCTHKRDLLQSGWLSTNSGTLDDLVGKLKQQLVVAQAADPDLTC